MNRDIYDLSQKPLKLLSTRVWRTYTGGRLIDELQRKEIAKDTFFPEDWVASLVIANNPGREHITEGLSEFEDGGKKFILKDVLSKAPIAFLGENHVRKYGSNTGVLVKMLDSAERLAIQVHPDNETAIKLFNSPYGKTEAWYIIGGREINSERPYVLFGFKPGITREKWKRVFDEQNIDEMLDCLHKFYVNPGDTFLIEGGLPHAIGPGCFMVEIQEPTDYTIRTERITPRGYKVPDMSVHQGAGFDKIFDCFHYDGLTRKEVEARWLIKPEIAIATENEKIYNLISKKHTDKFSMDLIEIGGEITLDKQDTFSVLVNLSGDGLIKYNGGETYINQGEQFFLPYNMGTINILNKGKGLLKIIRCFAPEAKD